MAERLQILVGKLDKCVNEGSDEKVSQCLGKMKSALDNVLDPLSGDIEWKRDSDDSAAELYSNIIDLVEEVEDVIDSYSRVMPKQTYGKTSSSKIELWEISTNMLQFLYKERQILSKILVFLQGMMAHFPDLLKKFSEKACNEFKKLKKNLDENSKQPGSEAKQMDSREGVSRKSAKPRCGQNHIASKRSTSRQQATKLSQTKASKVDIKKLPSKLNNITIKLSDEWWEELQRLVGRKNKLNELNEFFSAQKKSHSLVVAVTGVAGIGKTSLVRAIYKKVKRQFDCYAWVDMFGKSTSDAVRDILTLFSKKQPVSSPPCNASTMDEGSLGKVLSSFLTEKKFLLVLDDINSEADWTSFKTALTQNNCNGKVVMTSRKLDFSGCRNIKLKGLNIDDSCSLLFTEEEASKLSFDEKSVAEKISKLCEGIPLAIIIVRSMLSPEKPSTLGELLEKLNNISERVY